MLTTHRREVEMWTCIISAVPPAAVKSLSKPLAENFYLVTPCHHLHSRLSLSFRQLRTKSSTLSTGFIWGSAHILLVLRYCIAANFFQMSYWNHLHSRQRKYLNYTCRRNANTFENRALLLSPTCLVRRKQEYIKPLHIEKWRRTVVWCCIRISQL